MTTAAIQDPCTTTTDAMQLPRSTRGRRHGKARLLARSDLDGRSRAIRRYDAIVASVAADVGGEPSAVARELISTFAITAVHLDNLGSRSLLGQHVDITELSSLASLDAYLQRRYGNQSSDDHHDEVEA
jgi:hypothetical protein